MEDLPEFLPGMVTGDPREKTLLGSRFSGDPRELGVLTRDPAAAGWG